jgi:hypothetical protein
MQGHSHGFLRVRVDELAFEIDRKVSTLGFKQCAHPLSTSAQPENAASSSVSHHHRLKNPLQHDYYGLMRGRRHGAASDVTRPGTAGRRNSPGLKVSTLIHQQIDARELSALRARRNSRQPARITRRGQQVRVLSSPALAI